MKNLAGVEEADIHIQEELILAGIPMVREEKNKGEVPYTITGKLEGWDFSRAWYYWIASAKDCKGLPLEAATQMHEREYPIIGDNQPKNYGSVIRVAGNCGCPHPREWALPSGGKIKTPRFVESYHIDAQLGLNELARVIKESA